VVKELPEYIVIGVVERAYGVRGEIKVKPITDFPSRFKQLKTIFVEYSSGSGKEFEVSTVVLRGKFVYLVLEGIESREQAQTLQGGRLKIPRQQAMPLAADEFYHFEVVGFEIRTTAGQKLGLVEEVMSFPANDVLLVKNPEREYLIPVIKDVLKKIDRSAAQITIEVIDGLLD